MAPDRETVIEILVAVVAVVLFAAALVVIGVNSGQTIDGLTLVGAIAGFVVAMALVGAFFAFRE